MEPRIPQHAIDVADKTIRQWLNSPLPWPNMAEAVIRAVSEEIPCPQRRRDHGPVRVERETHGGNAPSVRYVTCPTCRGSGSLLVIRQQEA